MKRRIAQLKLTAVLAITDYEGFFVASADKWFQPCKGGI